VAGEERKKIILLGAGGREFHNFNVIYRRNPAVRVVAFTSAQIPFQEDRSYPVSLAGDLYPDGIPIVAESRLADLVHNHRVDEVILCYSDLSHQQVMEIASRVLALGADFGLIAPGRAMLRSGLPVISVGAVRTGCGKSPVTRYLCRLLREAGRHPVVIRHPMAYGRLDIRAVEKFQRLEDLDKYQCTLEEREEFEPLLRMGAPLFAGVDYEEIVPLAEREGDVLLWDGGNNDLPFVWPGLEIVLVDPCRAGDECSYFPGLVGLLRAGIVVLTKVDSASGEELAEVRRNLQKFVPDTPVAAGRLALRVDDPEAIRGKRVVVVEDGPTLTHGGMAFGAGVVAARRFGAAGIVDPRPCAAGSIADVYRDYPHLEKAIPAMGYSDEQMAHLKETLEAVSCDLVISATPVDLPSLLDLSVPVLQVRYEFEEEGKILASALKTFLSSTEQGQ